MKLRSAPSTASLLTAAASAIVLSLAWWTAWPDEDGWTPASRSELIWTTGELRTSGGMHYYLYRDGSTVRLVCPIGNGGRGPSFWCFRPSLRDRIGSMVTIAHSERRGLSKVAPIYEVRAGDQVLIPYETTRKQASSLGDRLARRSRRWMFAPLIGTVLVGWLIYHVLFRRLRARRSSETGNF